MYIYIHTECDFFSSQTHKFNHNVQSACTNTKICCFTCQCDYVELRCISPLNFTWNRKFYTICVRSAWLIGWKCGFSCSTACTHTFNKRNLFTYNNIKAIYDSFLGWFFLLPFFPVGIWCMYFSDINVCVLGIHMCTSHITDSRVVEYSQSFVYFYSVPFSYLNRHKGR